MNQFNDTSPKITCMQFASASIHNVKVFTEGGVLVDSAASEVNTQFTTTKLAAGTYQADVQSNVGGGTSAWSAPLFFRIHGSAPSIAAPTFSAPVSPTADTTPTFEWSPEYGANDFELLVYNAANGQVVLNTLTGGPSYAAPFRLPAKCRRPATSSSIARCVVPT